MILILIYFKNLFYKVNKIDLVLIMQVCPNKKIQIQIYQKSKRDSFQKDNS